jgi:MFS family permease
LVGMAGMVVSVVSFLAVGSEWQLIIPAVGFGCTHAILYPAVVAAGSMAFPPENRGFATILILAAWDLGLLIASPIAGVLLKYSGQLGLPPYPTMFLSIAALLAAIGVWYVFSNRCSGKN